MRVLLFEFPSSLGIGFLCALSLGTGVCKLVSILLLLTVNPFQHGEFVSGETNYRLIMVVLKSCMEIVL